MEDAKEIRIVFVTSGSMEEAKFISRELIETKLAACCNIVPGIVSIYEWKDNIQNDIEYLLIIKTHIEKIEELEKLVNQLHSYEVPEIISFPLESSSSRYKAWINECLNIDE